MLESILQKFRGIVLAFMVLSLSAVFVLQFGGPQAKGCSQRTGGSYAAEVYGDKITANEFRGAYALAGGGNVPPEFAKQNKLEEMVLQGLVERSLLARQARQLGFSTTQEDVMQKVAEDGVVHMSMSVNAGPYLPPSGPRRIDFKDAKGKFSKDNLKKFIQYQLRRSVEEFGAEQVEEALAQQMREAVTTQVTVGPSEIWDSYVREKESITLKYARFSPVFYRSSLQPSVSELGAFIKDNQKDVDAEYEREKHRYTGLEKQVRARHILIKAEESASADAKLAARKRADDLLTRAKKGEDFATLAKQFSEDTGSAKKGGDLGFNPKGRMVKPFDDAQFALKAGQLSDVVESQFGYHIIKVEAVREGDVPVDEAKRELGEKLYFERKSSELAKATAHKALSELQAGKDIDALNSELSGQPTAAAGSEAKEADPLAPQFRDTRPFGRTDTPITGPFDGAPLVRAAFEMTEDKPLASAPMQLGDEFVVYRLEQHVRAKREEMTDKDSQRIRDGLLAQKRREVLAEYVRKLMQKAQDDKAVFVDESALHVQTVDDNS
ncbi:MAG TPA: peptidylprolyl isomerase [Polyangiales bacterium]